ncbi:MAG: hypothetical protein JNM95_04365 [Chitinophagaceae bacterium]|nr:hypothetical protein [Chitinophagaceae bacterium]
MKNILLLLLITMLCSFQPNNEVHLTLSTLVKENKLSLKQLKQLKTLEINTEQARFLSCNVMVVPINHQDMYEFTLKSPDLLSHIEYKLMLSKLTSGDKVYLEDITVLLPTGNSVAVKPIVFTVN